MNEQKEYEYCLRCGRRLKSKEAQQLGYGKICYNKLKTTNRKSLFSLLTKKI